MFEPIIEATNVSFSYDKTDVLKNISFRIDKGQFVSILGPNGSGKTTLIDLLTGYRSCSSGQIKYQEKLLKLYSVKELAKNFAVVNQASNFKFPFTCFEMVMMGRNVFAGRIAGSGKKDMDKVYEVMAFTDTLEYADSYITDISGGEAQRVLLARALAQKPEVLFLDEAFSNMDISYRMRLLGIIQKLVRETGLTVISVIHDLNMAYAFSDEIIMLKSGKIHAKGNCREVMTQVSIKEVFEVDTFLVKDKGFIINSL
ncbi:MAG: ABC transporter ATP-binding protein [Eubacteriales bacterium]